ncbi:SDR family oxidoreductase [Pedobacter miscanthi]|uniref:SDR family NAD(P)-dependent oxidoreductase n=1 Tax=Pedobacter miscanthi TaxID=2259170 RepID=A0A366L4R0_9SPHI|nr:SDR family oxidoreductase [Pedobacter miscanthi]RBQ08875.1 SDR family NAD(P)-dependent oxidoreductase [Pedobacter miscanthi]
MKKHIISILGCGWFGLALAKKLIELGYFVKGSTTSEEKLATLQTENIQPYLVDFTAENMKADPAFFEADVLFICIPPKRNSTELHDYPQKIKSILEAAKDKSKHIVLISSTSVYSDENKTVNENSETNPDTDSGNVVLAAEKLFKMLFPENYTIIRFAGLIGPDRNPGRFFAGKSNVPNGLAPVNLIHQADAVGIAVKILEKQAFGRIYNACSPNHPAKMDYYTNAAQTTGLELPHFIAEKKDWKIVESLNVPEFLGYEFDPSTSLRVTI